MSDRNGQRIGFVFLWDLLEVEQHSHHVAYLLLVCTANPNNRLLDLQGRVLMQRKLEAGKRQQNSSPNVPQNHSRSSVLCHKHLLDHRTVRLLRLNQGLELFCNEDQAVWQLHLLRKLQAAAVDPTALPSGPIDKAKARLAASRIHPENS